MLKFSNTMESTPSSSLVDALFKSGVHYGHIRSRRHPSAAEYIFGTKEKVEIFDLEKTAASIMAAQEFIKKILASKGVILFVGSKPEARTAIARIGEKVKMPYVSGRWIGGTFTNFPEIKKRITRLETLRAERERGDFAKYTKRERIMLDKEISQLEGNFSGIISMKELPQAVFVVDAKREHIAVEEAVAMKIPVISLSSTDCDFSAINVPIPGNDASITSVNFVLDKIAEAFVQ